jgi:phosphoglycerol transferase MdoB-like AlkP superfamily enzyme
MKHYFLFILKLWFFWLIFFLILRILFLGFQVFYGYEIIVSEVFQSLFTGMYMDISMTSYIILLPLLLFSIQKFIPFNKLVYVYLIIIIALVSAIYACDTVLYREWGFRLDKSAFKYLTEFKEASSFVSLQNSISIALLTALGISLGLYIFRKLKISIDNSINKWVYLFNIILIPSLIIPMRGGLDIIPMNPGKVYFSNKMFPNHLALNVPWNIMYSVLQKNETRISEFALNSFERNQFLDSLHRSDNPDIDEILTVTRPKILFILLESFTANLIETKYNDEDVTPQLNKWLQEGLYFDNAYASGDRTEIGMSAIFSSFPAQPKSAIVHYPQKTQSLPSLIRILKDHGYTSCFYYGGDASFAAMNTYFWNMSVDQIIDKHAYPSETYNAKWGVHDHILFEKVYEDITKDTSQFLKICLSLSSHPPYEIPEPSKWPGTDEEILFLNSAYYTDKHLGIFIEKLKHLPVWNELLIVLMADHGCRFPGEVPYHTPAKFKIPVCLGGGVIREAKKIHKVISQTDLCATLLYQLGLTSDRFYFSKNALDKSQNGFAYYAFNNGFGWIDSGGVQVYSLDKHDIILKEGNPVTDVKTSLKYLECILAEFNK